MNKKEFIEILKEKSIQYSISSAGKIIIEGGSVYLPSLTSLPKRVEFNNRGHVSLESLTSLPEVVEFNNGENIYLPALTSLPKGFEFNNGSDVILSSLTSLPELVKFNNGGNVYLSSLTYLSKDVKFNNGGYIDLPSITSLPKRVEFNNGGGIRLSSGRIPLKGTYLERHNIEISDKNTVILYKKVSKDFKTQEGEPWETLWKIGSTVEHPSWDPVKKECGAGKFHACAKPHWCDYFRNEPGDKYIAIEIHVDDLYEWKDNPAYTQKIAFRKGKVLGECERFIK